MGRNGAGPDALRVFVQEKECGSASSLYLLLRKLAVEQRTWQASTPRRPLQTLGWPRFAIRLQPLSVGTAGVTQLKLAQMERNPMPPLCTCAFVCK